MSNDNKKTETTEIIDTIDTITAASLRSVWTGDDSLLSAQTRQALSESYTGEDVTALRQTWQDRRDYGVTRTP